MCRYPVIEIEHIYKKFLINHERAPTADSLKEILAINFKKIFRKMFLRRAAKERYSPTCEEFWALKDINLTIHEGDRIAILGRNGAGKSTLLKMISRISEPTHGRLKINGRVTSLLEVGTGFHPDLTGRENILLNGAIMGMSYKMIKLKFDEIVAFAEIEKFLDTPIKRYSSGMFMRLGFAIAAHLESDIMIVDEVLAVGDAQFQEKCLQKMNEMGREKRTVLFVSHNINSVLALCNKGILLEKGEVKAFEPIEECVSRYVRSCPIAGHHWRGEVGDDNIRITQSLLRLPAGDVGFYYQGEKTSLEIEFDILKPHPDLILGFSVLNSRNQLIARSRLCDHAILHPIVESFGSHKVSFDLDLSLFHPGEYQIRVDCSLLNRKRIVHDDILLKFAVYSQNKNLKHEIGVEKDGISLGNNWVSH